MTHPSTGRATSDDGRSLAALLARSFGFLGALLVVTLVVAVATRVAVLSVYQPRINNAVDVEQLSGATHQAMLDEESGLRTFLNDGAASSRQLYDLGRREYADASAQRARLIADVPDAAPALRAEIDAEQRWQQQWAEPEAAQWSHGTPSLPVLGGILATDRDLFDSYRAAHDRAQATVSQEINDAQADAGRLLTIGLAAIVALFLALAAVIALQYRSLRRAVVPPLEALLTRMEQIGSGDLEPGTPLRGPREFAALGGALEETAHALREAHDLGSERERQLSMQASRLLQAQEEAEQASMAKSTFLSRVSHELRTPLTAVIGFADLLLEEPDLSPMQREWVATVERAGNHLLELINEVLDISRIEAGEMSLVVEAVDAHALTWEVAELLRPVASRTSVELHVEDGAGTAAADRQRLRQVLLNLVSNAVKYNRPGGSVRIATSIHDGALRIDVHDTGPGVAADALRRLFTPFERLDAGERGIEGTGLGLSLSRSLVEGMHGRLEVTSEVGSGSCFSVVLPTAAAAEEADRRRRRPGDDDTARDRTPSGMVLYVEDVASNVRLVEGILARRPRVRLLSAMQAGVALDLARAHRPHLILLDLHLPDASGEEVLRQLRADATTADLPVVMLTADATQAQEERLRAAGADDYLTKPISVRALLEVVDLHLSGPRRSGAAVTEVDPDATAIPPPSADQA